jgi:uncharacterized OB-fold protein
MDASTIIRDVFEVLIVVAIGGMLITVIRRLRRGEIRVIRCTECGRPTSRAYPVCKWCGAPRPDDG